MSRIRAKDTKPELRVRSALHRMGYRFRLHRPDLPGKPDIVLPRYRVAIFVHGCYWHRHAGCRFAYTPKSRVDFWTQKFDDNVRRFELVRSQLADAGWAVHVIWECETEKPERLSAVLTSITEGLDAR